MAGIPLAALSIRPPEQDDSTGKLLQYLQMARQQQLLPGQLQQQQQQIQSTGLENQQRTMALQDQQILRGLYVKHSGDLDKVVQEAPAAGVSPSTVQQLQLHALDVKTKTAALVSQQGDVASKQADLMQGAVDAVNNAKPQDKPTVYANQRVGLQQAGLNVDQLPPQYPGDDTFSLIGAGVKGHSKQVDDALKAAEMSKNTAQATEATAGAEKTGMEVAAMKQFGGMTPAMAESRYLSVQSKLNQGQPISPDDKAFKAAYEKNKTLNTQFQFNLQNAGVGGSQGGQPSALAQMVATGQMKWNDVISPRTPQTVKEAFAKEVKSINPQFNSGDFAVEQAVKTSFTSGDYSKKLNAIATAREHMKTFTNLAGQLDNGDVQAFNALGNTIGVQFGDDKVTNFNIAKQFFAGEVGQAVVAGQGTGAEREQLANDIKNSSSPKQLAGALKTADALLSGKQTALQQTFQQGTKAQPNFGQANTNTNTAQPTHRYNPQTKKIEPI